MDESVPQLLARLRAKSLSLALSGDGVALRGDAGLLNEAERAALAGRQREIALYLKAHKATQIPLIRRGDAPPNLSVSQQSWWDWITPSPVQLSHERIAMVRRYAVRADAAEAALKRMVARHQVLCSHFSEQDGAVGVALHRADEFRVERGRAQTVESAMAEGEAFVSQALPVDGEWLFKAKLIEAGEQTVVAILVAHMIVDGVSAQLLSDELRRRLEGGAAEKAALDQPAPQFLDYAASERAWLQGPSGAVLTDYWLGWKERQTLLKSPSGAILTWQPGVNVSHAFTIPAAARDAVQDLAARHRASASSVLLVLYAKALARWSGQAHFAIRVVGNLRRTPALSALVGFMVCIDPVEVLADDGADFATLLKRVGTEYYNASMLRLPGFLKFPAQGAHPGVEQEGFGETIAPTFNFMTDNFMPGPRQGGGGKPMTWPPRIESTSREPWAALLWPVYLRLIDSGEGTRGLFQFNEALIGMGEQQGLMAEFFRVIAEEALDHT
jgi:hypothetical protein